MSQLTLDPISRDLQRVSGTFGRVTDGPEIVQHVDTRVLLIRGEAFLDTTLGVDYFGVVWIKGINPALVSAEIRDAIVGTPGVVEILTFEFDANDSERILGIEWTGEGSLDNLDERIPLHDRIELPAGSVGENGDT